MRFVRYYFLRTNEVVWPSLSHTRCSSSTLIIRERSLPPSGILIGFVVPQDRVLVIVDTKTPPFTLQVPLKVQTIIGPLVVCHSPAKVPFEARLRYPKAGSSFVQVPVKVSRNFAS